MDHDESEYESENSQDRAFIASEDEGDEDYVLEEDETDEPEEKIKQEAKDDTPDALIESMDTETLFLFQQSLTEEACANTGPRRSKRKRKTPKTWYELHPEDFQVLLEDLTPQDLCECDESSSQEEDEEESYQPSDSE